MSELFISHTNLGPIKSGIEFRQRLPVARFGRQDEIARIVLFLASELSSHMNGAFVAVDGGFLLAWQDLIIKLRIMTKTNQSIDHIHMGFWVR